MDQGSRQDRVVGAVVGSAVGDALGAPFEFGPAGVYTTRFPEGVGAMCGGGGWDPGEATDDTQMAVLCQHVQRVERGALRGEVLEVDAVGAVRADR
ncbi:ADP-ribosylglycohydrolase family protein, partial [Streptomyces sp. 900116325]